MFKKLANEVKIIEVGPRDGLQNESVSISLEDKLRYIELLAKSGLQVIEATSFVRTDKIPQMADAEGLFAKLKMKDFFDRVDFPCLVPNMKGYELASNVGVKEISLFSATSDEFTKKNINCTIDESFQRMKPVADQAKLDGVKIRGYISTAFGCPYAGEMSAAKLAKVIERFMELGVYEVSIGDTIGIGTPSQVNEYIQDIKSVIALDQVAMHFHDTRGMALANVLVSIENGISSFDSSSGGLGGCPYANGATGNIATEDVLYLLNSLGVKTGVDLNQVVEASKFILEKVNKTSPSKYFQTLTK